ncbi:MAG: hypothetical protein II942_04565 [Alphaproteobacteria bacterium]|nr:hypothetical protein [Alphaproteobacteria bacterium]
MKEFTPEQIEAMKHFPRTLPEDRRRFCELFLTPPSREEYLKAQARRNHQTESSDLVYNPVLSLFQKRNQRG